MTSIRCLACLAALLSSLLFAQDTQTKTAAAAPIILKEASITETANSIHIAANSPRPLTQVLDALRQKYGWNVDYEDPRYLSKSDIVERTAPNSAAHLFPAGGALDVDVPAGTPATAPPPEEKTLQLIVDAYNQSKNPGRFELRKNEDGSLAIVGVGEQNENGKTVA